MKANAVGREEGGDRGVDEFGPVISLHGDERERELCMGIGNKVDKNSSGVRFALERKSPYKVRKIIDNNEIVFEPRITHDRGCPKITMY